MRRRPNSIDSVKFHFRFRDPLNKITTLISISIALMAGSAGLAEVKKAAQIAPIATVLDGDAHYQPAAEQNARIQHDQEREIAFPSWYVGTRRSRRSRL